MTDRGLSRFDGSLFEDYNRKTGLPDEQIVQVAAVGRGVVAASRGGLVWIEDLSPTTRDPDTGVVRTSCGETPRVLKSGQIASVVATEQQLWYLAADRPPRLGAYRVDGQGCLEAAEEHTTRQSLRAMLMLGPGNLVAEGAMLDWHVLDRGTGQLMAPLSPGFLGGVHGVAGPFVLMRDGVARVTGQLPSLQMLTAPLGQGRGSLALTTDGQRLWVGRNGVVYAVDTTTGELRGSLKLPDERTVPTALAEDEQGQLWMGAESGLWVADLERTRVLGWPEREAAGKRIDSPAGSGVTNSSQKIEHAGFAEDGRVWLASSDELAVVDPQTGRSNHYAPDKGAVAQAWVGGNEIRISTSQGVFRKTDAGWEPVHAPYRLTRSDLEVLERENKLAEFWLAQPTKQSIPRWQAPVGRTIAAVGYGQSSAPAGGASV